MDATERIKSIMEQRGWSAYRLSKNCGLSENTIATILKRNSLPSISTLEAICKGFGITMSEFFAEGEMVEMTLELKELFDGWVNLNPEQKAAIQQLKKIMYAVLLGGILCLYVSRYRSDRRYLFLVCPEWAVTGW